MFFLEALLLMVAPRSPLVQWRQGLATAASAFVVPLTAAARSYTDTAADLSIALESFDGLLCLNFTVDASHGPFRAIVDTGSPFLIVPRVCSAEWGCDRLRGEGYKPAALSSLFTVESFGGQEYDVDWKSGDLKFAHATPALASKSKRVTFRNVVFGSVGQDAMRRPGGIFCGLVKNNFQGIKPTLLSQLDYNSFRLDVEGKTLTLSRTPLSLLVGPQKTEDEEGRVSSPAYIDMFDLRKLGAPVQHYAAKVRDLVVNGQRLNCGGNAYAILDSGTTGCVLSDDIFYNEFTPSLARSVSVTLQTRGGGLVTLSAGAERPGQKGKGLSASPFVVSPAFVPWSGFRRAGVTKENPFQGSDRAELSGPSLVVLGLPFLRGRVLSADPDAGIILLE